MNAKKTITLMYLSMYYNSLQAATYQHSTPDSNAQLHWFYYYSKAQCTVLECLNTKNPY